MIYNDRQDDWYSGTHPPPWLGYFFDPLPYVSFAYAADVMLISFVSLAGRVRSAELLRGPLGGGAV